MIVDVVIEPGLTRSEPILLGHKALTGFLQPYSLETPAGVFFEVSTDNTTWHILMQHGAPVQLMSGAQYTSIDPALTRAFQYIRVVTGRPGYEVDVSSSQGDFRLVVEDVSGGGTSELVKPRIEELTIAAGQSKSESLQLWGYVPVAVVLPAAWTAAPLSFLINPLPGATSSALEFALYDETGEYTLDSAAAGRIISINHCLFLGMAFVVVRSGTESSPVVQSAQRTLQMVLRMVI